MAALLVSGFGAMPVTAQTTLTVDGDTGTVQTGDPCPTPRDSETYAEIEAAVHCAIDGDTINVRPGTYSELIYMEDRNDLIIQSTDGPETTIVDARQTGEASPPSPTTPTHPAFYLWECDNITIDGFTITDSILDASTGNIYQSTDPYLMTGVLLHSSSNWTVQNNILYNFYHGIYLSGEAG